jgi:hypothetical protein
MQIKDSTMTPRIFSLVLSLTVVSLTVVSLISCTGGNHKARNTTQPPGQRPKLVEHASSAPAVTSSRTLNPLQLTMSGVVLDQQGLVELSVKVTRLARLPAPGVVLKVTLPRGAALENGMAEETFDFGSAKVMTRVFRVRNPGSERVRVEAIAEGPASGARAWATYPKAPPAPPTPVKLKKIKPVTIHGVVIDRAVPIKGK